MTCVGFFLSNPSFFAVLFLFLMAFSFIGEAQKVFAGRGVQRYRLSALSVAQQSFLVAFLYAGLSEGRFTPPIPPDA